MRGRCLPLLADDAAQVHALRLFVWCSAPTALWVTCFRTVDANIIYRCFGEKRTITTSFLLVVGLVGLCCEILSAEDTGTNRCVSVFGSRREPSIFSVLPEPRIDLRIAPEQHPAPLSDSLLAKKTHRAQCVPPNPQSPVIEQQSISLQSLSTLNPSPNRLMNIVNCVPRSLIWDGVWGRVRIQKSSQVMG